MASGIVLEDGNLRRELVSDQIVFAIESRETPEIVQIR